MVQSVELLLDAASEERVLREWRALETAGLPSQSRQTAPSNRPHVTLVAIGDLEPEVEPILALLCAGALPVRVCLGPLAVFGRGPYVFVRVVVATPGLLSLQAAMATAIGVPQASVTAPARWVAHVTLARRMSAEQVATALTLLSHAEPDPPDAYGEHVRRWDGTARREWLVA